jgi:hypothetical protein
MPWSAGQGDHTTQRFKLRQIAVHHGVEIIGARRSGGMLVLDVIRGGQVHHIRAHFLHQFDAGGKDELRQVGAVDAGQGLADQREHVADAVLAKGGLIGLFGGKNRCPSSCGPAAPEACPWL